MKGTILTLLDPYNILCMLKNFQIWFLFCRYIRIFIHTYISAVSLTQQSTRHYVLKGTVRKICMSDYFSTGTTAIQFWKDLKLHFLLRSVNDNTNSETPKLTKKIIQSGAQIGQFNEKNKGVKSSWQCPHKLSLINILVSRELSSPVR